MEGRKEVKERKDELGEEQMEGRINGRKEDKGVQRKQRKM